MQVRALQSFVDESGRHSAGDVFQMADGLAVVRIKAGLVQRIAGEPELAVRREPELAVSSHPRRMASPRLPVAKRQE